MEYWSFVGATERHLTPKDTCGPLSWSKYLLRANSSLASSCKLGNALLASNNRSSSKSAQDYVLVLPLSALELYFVQLPLAGQFKSLAQGFLGGCIRLWGLVRQSTICHMCLSCQSNSQQKDLIIVTPSINSKYTLKVAYPIGKTSISIKNLWEY